MANIEKIIMVDRVLEKLTDEQMAEVKKSYAEYCTNLYSFVGDIKIPDKEARAAIYSAMLSPYQYFIEDVVRIKRLKENRLEQQQQQGGFRGPVARGPVGGQPAQRPEFKKQEWKKKF